MKNIDLVLLEQWLSDQSFVNWAKQQSDIDIAKWEEYLNGDSRLWETAKVGKQILLGISFKEIQRNKEHSNNSLKSLLIKIDSSKIASSSKKKEKKDTKVFRIPQRWRIASSVASILIIASVAFFQFFHSSEVLYATGFGEQMEIELPDGTSVTLNANSKLAYNSKKSRVVQLEGEAFFEVVKKIETNENFQVITPDLAVTVLGTSFNVNARNDQTKVYLEEGIVELKIEEEEIINEQETVQVEENQEVEVEAVKEEPTPEELIQASNDKFLRLFAEFENYKKRTTKERIELFKTAGQEVMTSLLPVVDDFERALSHIEENKETAELKKGVELIYQKFYNTLELKGLSKVETRAGDAFDAEFHEAITQIPAPSDDLKGKVIDCIEKGYKLGDKIIRYPKVVIGQ